MCDNLNLIFHFIFQESYPNLLDFDIVGKHLPKI